MRKAIVTKSIKGAMSNEVQAKNMVEMVKLSLLPHLNEDVIVFVNVPTFKKPNRIKVLKGNLTYVYDHVFGITRKLSKSGAEITQSFNINQVVINEVDVMFRGNQRINASKKLCSCEESTSC